jgi:hypothetical protein
MAEVPEWPISTVSSDALERTISSFDTVLWALFTVVCSTIAGPENWSE